MTPPGIQFGIVALALGLVSFRPSLVEAPPVAQDEQEVSVPGAPDARQPIQWRVIWTTDPQHTATISWSTVADTKDNHLWIRPMQADAEARKVGAQRNGAFTLNGTEKK
ncbi:MAG: hypothetical protein ACJAVJ_002577, partial [Planctomycetota bacterium]